MLNNVSCIWDCQSLFGVDGFSLIASVDYDKEVTDSNLTSVL